MKSTTNFINSEGIEIIIKIPYDTHPDWSKKVEAWIHVIEEMWGFRKI